MNIISNIKSLYRVFYTIPNIELSDLLKPLSYRANPCYVGQVIFSPLLTMEMAPSFACPGCYFDIGYEIEDLFENFFDTGMQGPVGLLIDDLNKYRINNEIVINTIGFNKNIEFLLMV